MKNIDSIVSGLESTKTDWEERLDLISQIISLADKYLVSSDESERHIQLFVPIIPSLCVQLTDTRSSIAKKTCQTIVHLISKINEIGFMNHSSPFVEQILPYLFHNVIVTVKVIAETAHYCVSSIISNTFLNSNLIKIICEGTQALHAKQRICCIYLVWLFFENPSIEQIQNTDLNLIHDTIHRASKDADPTVRSSARDCHKLYVQKYSPECEETIKENKTITILSLTPLEQNFTICHETKNGRKPSVPRNTKPKNNNNNNSNNNMKKVTKVPINNNSHVGPQRLQNTNNIPQRNILPKNIQKRTISNLSTPKRNVQTEINKKNRKIDINSNQIKPNINSNQIKPNVNSNQIFLPQIDISVKKTTLPPFVENSRQKNIKHTPLRRAFNNALGTPLRLDIDKDLQEPSSENKLISKKINLNSVNKDIKPISINKLNQTNQKKITPLSPHNSNVVVSRKNSKSQTPLRKIFQSSSSSIFKSNIEENSNIHDENSHSNIAVDNVFVCARDRKRPLPSSTIDRTDNKRRFIAANLTGPSRIVDQ